MAAAEELLAPRAGMRTNLAEELLALRAGMRTNLAQDLQRVAAANSITLQEPELRAHAMQLEAAANGSALRRSRSMQSPHRELYFDTMRALGTVLPLQVGHFPDEVLALLYFARRLTAEEVIEQSLAPPGELEPREKIRRLFVRVLVQASPVLAADRPRALGLARQIEMSCFNASVRASKESEEPPRRQWDSPAFVDIYSTRCGTIATLLSPDSTSSQAYGGDHLVQRLLGTEGVARLDPEALGNYSEKDLCPAATARERAEIARRSEQKVVEKESNLFRCPHCSERRCTYVEVQRRSLDEAPDYMCRCLNCKRRFTGRG